MKDQNDIPTEMLPSTIIQNITINGNALEPKPGTITLKHVFDKLTEILDVLQSQEPKINNHVR